MTRRRKRHSPEQTAWMLRDADAMPAAAEAELGASRVPVSGHSFEQRLVKRGVGT